MKKTVLFTLAALLALAGVAEAQRDQIRIVGSSTVCPFSTKVAEQFGRTTSFKTPVTETPLSLAGCGNLDGIRRGS